jgi:hypothetical protein
VEKVQEISYRRREILPLATQLTGIPGASTEPKHRRPKHPGGWKSTIHVKLSSMKLHRVMPNVRCVGSTFPAVAIRDVVCSGLTVTEVTIRRIIALPGVRKGVDSSDLTALYTPTADQINQGCSTATGRSLTLRTSHHGRDGGTTGTDKLPLLYILSGTPCTQSNSL